MIQFKENQPFQTQSNCIIKHEQSKSIEFLLTDILQETIGYLLFMRHIVPLSLQQCKLVLSKRNAAPANQILRIQRLFASINNVSSSLARWTIRESKRPSRVVPPVLLVLGKTAILDNEAYLIDIWSMYCLVTQHSDLLQSSEKFKRDLMRSLTQLWQASVPQTQHSSQSVYFMVPILQDITAENTFAQSVPQFFNSHPQFSLFKSVQTATEAKLFHIFVSASAATSQPPLKPAHLESLSSCLSIQTANANKTAMVAKMRKTPDRVAPSPFRYTFNLDSIPNPQALFHSITSSLASPELSFNLSKEELFSWYSSKINSTFV